MNDHRKAVGELEQMFRAVARGYDGAIVSIACAMVAADSVVAAADGDRVKLNMLCLLHGRTFGELVTVAEIERG